MQILNHRKLDHPHVIILQEVFPTPNHLVLVLEYANRNTVRHLLSAKGRLSEAEARRLFQQLMLAVDYCQILGIQKMRTPNPWQQLS